MVTSIYTVFIVRYDSNDSGIPVSESRKLVNARSRAYKELSHKKGMNVNGRYKAKICCTVFGGNYHGLTYWVGEITNNVYDMRYWYPMKGGKYELKSNGTLGKKLH